MSASLAVMQRQTPMCDQGYQQKALLVKLRMSCLVQAWTSARKWQLNAVFAHLANGRHPLYLAPKSGFIKSAPLFALMLVDLENMSVKFGT